MVDRFNQGVFFDNYAVRTATAMAARIHALAVLSEPTTGEFARERTWLARLILGRTPGDASGPLQQFALAVALTPGIYGRSTSVPAGGGPAGVDPAKLVNADFDTAVANEWTRIARLYAPAAPEPGPVTLG